MAIYHLAKKKYYVSEEIKKQRLAICKQCPNLKFGVDCGICFCLVGLLTKLKTEKCPDNPPRWEEQD